MRALARRHGINQKTVAKWKKRESTAGLWCKFLDGRGSSGDVVSD